MSAAAPTHLSLPQFRALTKSSPNKIKLLISDIDLDFTWTRDPRARETLRKKTKVGGIVWDVEKQAENSAVAARAQGQTGRPSNGTKHRPRGRAQRLKG